MARTNDRERYHYGICINRNAQDGRPCPKCTGKAKDVQKIRKGSDLKCEECNEPLRQVPPPRPKPWKKILLIAGIAIVLGVGYFMFSTGGKTPPPPPTSISLDQLALSLKAGETAQLTATVQPNNATDKSVTWSSSDERVAKVENGKVTAVAEGNAEITASIGKCVSPSCKVEVIIRPIEVTSVTLDPTSLSLKAGETAQLTATVLPKDATDKSVTWSSSNEKVATVSETGLVRAVANKDKAKITAKIGNVSARCEVEVIDGKPEKTCPTCSKKLSECTCKKQIEVPGGTYTGETKNGKPHGMGTIRYNTRTLIDSRDSKKRYAEAGQYISGQFYEGRLEQGKLFDDKGNHIETIIIGGGAHR